MRLRLVFLSGFTRDLHRLRMASSLPRWDTIDTDASQLERLGIELPVFRVQSRTPHANPCRNRSRLSPLLENDLALSDRSGQSQEASAKGPRYDVDIRESYLALDIPDSGLDTSASSGSDLELEDAINDDLGDFSSIFKYLQSERDKLVSNSSSDSASGQGDDQPIQVQVLQSRTSARRLRRKRRQQRHARSVQPSVASGGTQKPSALSHEITATSPPPQLAEGADQDQARFATRASTPKPSSRKSRDASSSSSRVRKASEEASGRPSPVTAEATGDLSTEPIGEEHASSESSLDASLMPPVESGAIDISSLSMNPDSSFLRPASLDTHHPQPSQLTAVPPRLQRNSSTKKPVLPALASDPIAAPVKTPPKFKNSSDRVRSLMQKLEAHFPEDTANLRESKRSIFPTVFASPEDDEEQANEPQCWTFIDNSNIVVGFLDYFRNHPEMAAHSQNPRKPKLDYHSFFAVLERGRSARRKILVGSNPLDQSLDAADAWAYEVHLLSRVLKPVKESKPSRGGSYKTYNTDSSTTDSGSGADDSDSEPFRYSNHRNRHKAGSRTSNAQKSQQEQAVDEVLQVRMYESLFGSKDGPQELSGTTLVLASGDGAASEFSPSGFLGPTNDNTRSRKGSAIGSLGNATNPSYLIKFLPPRAEHLNSATVMQASTSTARNTMTSSRAASTAACSSSDDYRPEKREMLQSIQDSFWQDQFNVAEHEDIDFKKSNLPLARIKKVMKTDPSVKMIAAEVPIIFSKACEAFIAELALRAWVEADKSDRKTLGRADIASALQQTDMYDFLIDIVPREDSSGDKKARPAKRRKVEEEEN